MVSFTVPSSLALLLVWVFQADSKILRLFPELEMRTAALQAKFHLLPAHNGCRVPPVKYGSVC